MDKRRAIQIMTNAAKLYRDNLEDQKLMFLYGIPAEVKRKAQTEGGCLDVIRIYEVVFHTYNFMHLTGVRRNVATIASATHFYQKCIAHRLTEKDFMFAPDGSSEQKLDILESTMQIKTKATMIGEFTDRGPSLFTEKVAGNICGCIGFVQDKNTMLNVPNTLLKKDIRDVTEQPTMKIYAVLSKGYTEEKYSVWEKTDKEIDLRNYCLAESIETRIARKKGGKTKEIDMEKRTK